MKTSTSGAGAAAAARLDPAFTSAERSIVRLRNSSDKLMETSEAPSASMNGNPTRKSAVGPGGGNVPVTRHVKYRINRTNDIPVINDRARVLSRLSQGRIARQAPSATRPGASAEIMAHRN